MFLSSPIVRYGMIFVYMKKESPANTGGLFFKLRIIRS